MLGQLVHDRERLVKENEKLQTQKVCIEVSLFFFFFFFFFFFITLKTNSLM